MVLQCLILLVWLLPIPIVIGSMFTLDVNKTNKNIPFMWISGQIILWAIFQIISVPIILLFPRLEEKYGMLFEKPFETLIGGFLVITGAVFVYAIIKFIKGFTRKKGFKVVPNHNNNKSYMYYIIWALFWLLLLFQLVQAIRLAYADGDDAFYVAVSLITEESNEMYIKLPYTGGTRGLDTRYGLAPFPIWISFLARISGMHTTIVAHIIMPLLLIPMTYAIYYLIGRKICGQKHSVKLPLFLFFVELLVIFGDYSLYTTEHFMITRSRQGKAALGNIIIPMLIYLLLLILERLEQNVKLGKQLWILLTATIIAGCLCSTLSSFLTCMLIGIVGICGAVCYKRIKILIPFALSCVPALAYILLFFVVN